MSMLPLLSLALGALLALAAPAAAQTGETASRSWGRRCRRPRER